MSQNPQMDVLYMKDFGHVLGIFTRTSEPEKMETDVSAFVGDGLHLRGLVNGQDLVVAPDLIGIFRADRNWRQIFQPLTLYASGPPNAPTLKTFSGPLSLAFATPDLTITVTAGNTANVLVLALDTAGGTPVSFNAQVAAGQSAINVPMTGLAPGHHYNAFVFVPTYPISHVSPTFVAP